MKLTAEIFNDQSKRFLLGLFLMHSCHDRNKTQSSSTWNIHKPTLTDKQQWKVHWSTTEWPQRRWRREVWGKQSPRAPTTPLQQWQQQAGDDAFYSWFDSWWCSEMITDFRYKKASYKITVRLSSNCYISSDCIVKFCNTEFL